MNDPTSQHPSSHDETPSRELLKGEPRRHRGFMIALGLAALATVPAPFVGREVVWLLGVPLWLWWSFAATAVLSGLTAWGLLRLWPVDPES